MTQIPQTDKQPKEMYLLALTEMCQRFAFWGVGNLLVLYLVQSLKFTDKAADQLFGIFTGVAFVLPLLGGYIADRFNYRAPVYGGIFLTAAGCFLIATGWLPALYLALGLTAFGAGLFTPSIYALLGTLYHKHHSMREAGFSIYYASVNIGVFLAMIVLGYIGQAWSWSFAFFTAAVIQLLGIIPFRMAIKRVSVDPTHMKHSMGKIGKKAPLHKHEKQRILVICILAFFSIFFWIAYNQGGSSMNLFALRYTDRNLFSFKMPPSWLLSSESLYLILFAFPLAQLYMYLSRRKRDPSPPMKCALSLFAIGFCFLLMVKGSAQIPRGATTAAVSPFYLLGAYAFMAIGEMLICPIGLSLITHLSPHRFTALLVGVWYLCIGIAFYLGGAIAPLMNQLKELTSFFSLFVIFTFIAGTLLIFLVKKLNALRRLDTL